MIFFGKLELDQPQMHSSINLTIDRVDVMVD